MISSQGRYNHFDTTPYELALVLYQQARAKSRGFLRKSRECFLGRGKSEEKLRISAAKEVCTDGALFVETCPKFPLQIPIFGAIVGRRRELARQEFKTGGLIAMRYDLRDMTRGNLWKQILVFSLPLMASNLLQVLFNMSDIAVVGQFAGSHALGSVGSTATLAALYSGFLIGMGAGVNVLTARFIGAREEENTRQTVHTAAVVCLGLGMILMALCFTLARPLLTLLGTKDELIDGAILYLRIYAFGLPAMALYNFGSAVLTATGDTKRPLLFLSIAGGLNICLNLFFVIVCKMAADGVALATIISQYTSAALVLRVLLRAQESYRLELKNFVFSGEKAQRILALGVASGMQHAIFAIANLFIQSAVNSFSAAVVEGNSAAANADSLVYEVMAAPYTACSTFISQNYGARNKKRIMQAYRVSLVYSFGVGAVLGLALMFFGGGFLRIFTPDPEVIAAGMEKLQIMGWSYAFSAFMDNTLAASRGLGKSAVPMAIVILGSCVFRVIWVYTIFAMFHTLTALYLLYIFSWSLTAIGQMVYFFRTYQKQTDGWEVPQTA